MNIAGFLLAATLGAFFLFAGPFQPDLLGTVFVMTLGVIALFGAVIVAFDTEPKSHTANSLSF